MSASKGKRSAEISALRIRVLTLTVGATVFNSGLIVSALGPLLPEIQSIYGVSVVSASWVFTLLLIGSAVGLAILPRLGDLAGDKLAMTIVPFVLASGFALAATGSFAALLIGSLGIGVGGNAPAIAVGALRRILPGRSIGRAVSITMTAILIGAGLGYIAGGIALDYITLREYFASSALMSAVIALAVYLVFPKAPAADRGSLGIISVALLVGWIVTILFALSRATEWGWANPKTLGVLVIGIFVGSIWAIRESKLSTPIIDLTLFQSSKFRTSLFGGLTLGMGGSAFLMLFPMIAQLKGAGYGPQSSILATGLIMTPYAIAGIVGVAIASRMTARGKSLLAAAVGAACHGLGAIWVAFFHNTELQLFAGAVIYGVGIGLLNSGLYSSIQMAVSDAKAGMANTALGVTAALAGAAGPVIYAIILAQESVSGLPGIPTERQFVVAFLIMALVDFACAIVCIIGLRRPT